MYLNVGPGRDGPHLAPAGPEVKPPLAFIQWKGTDVCLDFACECGANGHYDGDFAYAIRCHGCDKVWMMPAFVPLIEITPAAIYHYDYAVTCSDEVV